MQGRVVPGLKKEAHCSREEEGKWLLLPGPNSGIGCGASLLSQLPHSGKGASALWGMRAQAPDWLQKLDLEARINRDNMRPSTRSKKQGHQGRARGPEPQAASTSRLRI